MKSLKRYIRYYSLKIGFSLILLSISSVATADYSRAVGMHLIINESLKKTNQAMMADINERKELSVLDAQELMRVDKDAKYDFLPLSVKKLQSAQAVMKLIVGLEVPKNYQGYFNLELCKIVGKGKIERACLIRQLWADEISRINRLAFDHGNSLRTANLDNINTLWGQFSMQDAVYVLKNIRNSKSYSECIMKTIVGLPLGGEEGSEICAGIDFSAAKDSAETCIISKGFRNSGGQDTIPNLTLQQCAKASLEMAANGMINSASYPSLKRIYSSFLSGGRIILTFRDARHSR